MQALLINFLVRNNAKLWSAKLYSKTLQKYRNSAEKNIFQFYLLLKKNAKIICFMVYENIFVRSLVQPN